MPTHLNALPDGYKLHEYELVRVLGVGALALLILATTTSSINLLQSRNTYRTI